MKKLLSLVLAATVSAGSAFAATGTPAASTTTAPASVDKFDAKAVAHFNADFKDASAVWTVNGDYNEVLFFWHNDLMDSYYDKDGNLIGTFHNVKVADLPVDAQHGIATWYKKYTVTASVVMDKEGEDPVYYVTIESPAHIRILEVKNDGSLSEFKTIR